ncbi:pesticin C-terminus-like muramidase [Cronobacter malonaticus]
MKISYPIRDTDGQAFRSCDDVMRLVDDEPHGTWLLGTNALWHGGIHISEVSNPFSALNPGAVNTGEPVPLQFMADGTVVAYRLNSAYLTAPYGGKPLRYSSSFVLVKSVCQPDPQKEKSWLEFYCLYLHLAAVADYPLSPCYKVRDGHSGIRLRKYTPGQNGLPEGAAENGAAGDYAAPAKTKRSLKAGDRFVVSRTGRFYVKNQGQSTLTTFGLARLLNGDVPGAEQYWVTLDAALTEPDGDMPLLMPDWMRRAVQQGVYDEVVLTEEADDWTVSAGTPVGFMGCTESPSENSTDVDKEWYVHLEVLSTDSRMPAFLTNPEGVDGEKRWLLVPKGKTLYVRQDSEDGPVFTSTTARVSAQSLLSREAATPVADASKTWWYNITGEGWLPQGDVEEINQYDLVRQGFQPLEETGGGDVMQSPYEGWVPEAFGEISRSAEQGAAHQYSQVPAFYGDLMTEMDGNRDGKVTAEEVRQALTVRDPLVKAVVNRLVVKHHSEWCKGRSTGRWEGFYRELDPLELNYCEKWQADLEWMSQVPPFDKDEAVWHFHPVVFLNSIRDADSGVIKFETTRGTYTISRKSADFILKEEGYVETPYVPDNNNSSGVTLGYGYDLGQQTIASMRATISEFYTEEQLIRLQLVVGLTGQKAINALPGISDITISKDDATELAMKMKAKYAQIVVDTYPEILTTHPHCQGAMLSLVINRGTSFTIPSVATRIEMKNIQTDFMKGYLTDIPVQIRSMKRLWVGKGLDGLINRREGEAKLFEEGLAL